MQQEPKQIYVAMWDGAAGRPIPVGVLSYLEEPIRRAAGTLNADGEVTMTRLRTTQVAFSYLAGYDGPPLDPEHLNYKRERRRSFRLDPALAESGLFRVFTDYLPGSWGRRQIWREHPETRQMNDLQLLGFMAAAGRTVGALHFFMRSPRQESPYKQVREVDEFRVKSLRELASLAVHMTDRDLDASLVHGGARPKTTLHDVHGEVGSPGVHYLVKFNVRSDGYNLNRLEHATHEIMREAGIDAVGSKIVRMSVNGEVLADMYMTPRYDRLIDESGGEVRRHRVSVFALTNPADVASQDRGDYGDIFLAVAKHSSAPAEDLRELARRLIFNIGMNSTDDHLRNFEMITDETGGFRLAPAFDVSPTPYAYPHASSILGLSNGSISDRGIALIAERLVTLFDRSLGSQATRLLPSGQELLEMRDQVLAAMSNWQATLLGSGCGPEEFAIAARAIGAAGTRAASLLGISGDADKAVKRQAAQCLAAIEKGDPIAPNSATPDHIIEVSIPPPPTPPRRPRPGG